MLALQTERLTARREHFQVAGGLEQPRDERSRREEMLEVVEDEEQPPVAQEPYETALLVRPERVQPGRVGDRRRHEPGVGDALERRVEHAVGEAWSEPARRLYREPRLAEPPGPVRVTRRTSLRSTRLMSFSSSRSRPTNEVVRAGSPDGSSDTSVSA